MTISIETIANVITLVVVLAAILFRDSRFRQALNDLTGKIEPTAKADDIGAAVALKFADVLQPVFTLWKENSEEMRATIDNLRKQREAQATVFEDYKKESIASYAQLQRDIEQLKIKIRELETQVAEVPVLKSRLAQFEISEAAMKKERDEAMIALAKVQERLEMVQKRAETLERQHNEDVVRIAKLEADSAAKDVQIKELQQNLAAATKPADEPLDTEVKPLDTEVKL